MFDLVSKLSYKDLLLLKECIEHEIVLSETAQKEGFEETKADDLKQLQEEEISLHSELLTHVKKEGTKKFFEILQQYIDNQIELEKHCNQ